MHGHQPLGHRQQRVTSHARDVALERAEPLAADAVLDLGLLLDDLRQSLVVVANLRLQPRALERRELLRVGAAHRRHLLLLRPVQRAADAE